MSLQNPPTVKVVITDFSYWHYIGMIIDRLRQQLSLRVVVWNSVICIDHSRPNKARSPTNHTTPEGPVQPCGPVRFSVADNTRC